MANDLIPFKEDGERVTCTPSTAVVGMTLVVISGNANADGTYTIAPAGAGGKVFGVACWDAPIGGKVTVVTVPSGHIVPILAGAVLAAGVSVTPDASGHAVVAAGDARACGIVITGAADEAYAMIQLAHHTA
jgi:predicted RecA/RadA family phage recombinase